MKRPSKNSESPFKERIGTYGPLVQALLRVGKARNGGQISTLNGFLVVFLRFAKEFIVNTTVELKLQNFRFLKTDPDVRTRWQAVLQVPPSWNQRAFLLASLEVWSRRWQPSLSESRGVVLS